MAEEELDLSLLKKKKKTKKPTLKLDDDGESPIDNAVGEPAVAEPSFSADPAVDDSSAAAPEASFSTSLAEELSFGDMKKKKKKPKKDTAEGGEEPVAEPVAVVVEAAPVSLPEAEMDLSEEFGKKKKKKKDKPLKTDLVDIDLAEVAVETPLAEREYTYAELLERVFDIMRSKNPDAVAGEKKRFVMKPPQVIRLGTKKSAFVNFTEICKTLHRTPDHLLNFLLSELGTSGSVDGSNALVLKGRFQQKQIEHVLRGYIREYVTCHTCKSPDTTLQKENRLFFLKCETCGSKCSVTSIKSGFQAVTGKRAAIRAKTAT